MKHFTVSLQHAELTTLILDHLKMYEATKDQRYKNRADQLATIQSRNEPKLVEQSPPSDSSPET